LFLFVIDEDDTHINRLFEFFITVEFSLFSWAVWKLHSKYGVREEFEIISIN